MTNVNVIRDFDTHFPNGVYSEPTRDIPLYDFKRMREYCKNKGITTSRLTEDELLGFQISKQ